MNIRGVILKLIIAIIASLPFSIRYIFSDFPTFIMQYVIGYRKGVVIQNLENSFPHKDTLMIEYKKIFRTLLSLKDKLFTVFVLADQSPPKTEMNYFEEFLGQKSAFHNGMEKVARALNHTVIFLDVRRTGSGHYEVETLPLVHDAKKTKEGDIIKSYIYLLENSIRNNPDNWLWSHRRWKKREEKPN